MFLHYKHFLKSITSVIKRPKSAFAVTKELKQKEHEQLLCNNTNNNNLFNQSMKQNISTIEHQTRQVKVTNDNNTTTNTTSTTTTNNNTNNIDYSKILTNQYFYQSSNDINQFKYYLLKQIHYLKRNQFNHKQNVQSIKDTYIDLDIKYNNNNNNNNNNIVTNYNELDQLDIFINDNINKSYKMNSSNIHKLRSYSAPSINRKLSDFSNFNIQFMNHWKQDNEQCINLNSIQLPNLIVS
ncbi:unnamed protein product [Schistosoma margrebowiei]|uniref:Uncharacterized protein n=1 Tax=Schistosoma margrebowiei TaxID=48269 RepID=A0A183M728_9TREM|nr:unnamed protein product [Schistosoma margrebowiei]